MGSHCSPNYLAVHVREGPDIPFRFRNIIKKPKNTKKIPKSRKTNKNRKEETPGSQANHQVLLFEKF